MHLSRWKARVRQKSPRPACKRKRRLMSSKAPGLRCSTIRTRTETAMWWRRAACRSRFSLPCPVTPSLGTHGCLLPGPLLDPRLCPNGSTCPSNGSARQCLGLVETGHGCAPGDRVALWGRQGHAIDGPTIAEGVNVQPRRGDVSRGVDALHDLAWADVLLVALEAVPQQLGEQPGRTTRAMRPQGLNVAEEGPGDCEQPSGGAARALCPVPVLEGHAPLVGPGHAHAALGAGAGLRRAAKVPCELAEAPRFRPHMLDKGAADLWPWPCRWMHHWRWRWWWWQLRWQRWWMRRCSSWRHQLHPRLRYHGRCRWSKVHVLEHVLQGWSQPWRHGRWGCTVCRRTGWRPRGRSMHRSKRRRRRDSWSSARRRCWARCKLAHQCAPDGADCCGVLEASGMHRQECSQRGHHQERGHGHGTPNKPGSHVGCRGGPVGAAPSAAGCRPTM